MGRDLPDRPPAWHDKALDFRGPVDFARHCEAQGAKANIDPDSGKLTVVTKDGRAKLPAGPRYSYTEQRQSMHNLQAIGITFAALVLLIMLFVIPFLAR